MKKILFILLTAICFTATVNAQRSKQKMSSDSIVIESQDTVLLKSYAKRYSPRKALLYAAILPGAGQVYTKKYWKLPLVYGGFFAIGYGINFYNKGFKKYKGQLFQNLETGLGADNAPSLQFPYFTTSQLRTIVDRYRRQRDFMILLMGGMYLLQMVDAHIDAHLKEFDLNPNLHVSIEPTMEQDILIGRQTGVALIIKF
jgi:hypothetical protein